MEAVAALVPSIGVGLLFWWVIRALVNADRSERQAMAELDRREHERARAEKDVTSSSGAGD
ncbi:hypothetical protein [Thalassiella azotivora]